MQNAQKPEDVILRIVREFIIAAYTLFILLATGFIVVGKFTFDVLYRIVEQYKHRQQEKKYVECAPPKQGNQ
jgi:hypothetical protein